MTSSTHSSAIACESARPLGTAPSPDQYPHITGLVKAGDDPDDLTERQAISAWLTEQYDLLPDFGWLDGGCLTLAMAYRMLGARYSRPVEIHAFYRQAGRADHFIARPVGADRYFDGDGFATDSGVVDKMLEWERVTGWVDALPCGALEQALAGQEFWYSEAAAADLCDRMDKAFGPSLLACA